MEAASHFAFRAAISSHYGGGSIQIPPAHVMVHEQRPGGYALSVELRPRVRDSAAALQSVIDQGIEPGSSALVTLILAGRESPARSWPGVVTGIATREPRRGERGPAAIVTLADPFTACGERPLWLALADVDLAELLGAALGSVAGGDGVPSKSPVIPGLPPIEIRSEVRESVATLPYVISAGETLSTWLDSLSALLKVRVELVGLADGSLVATITDRSPRLSGLNANGAIPLRIQMQRPVSPRNVHVRRPRMGVSARERGGLADIPSLGAPWRFGRQGPVDQVFESARTSREESELRAEMDTARRGHSQLRIEIESGQPGLVPGRVVSFADPPRDRDGNALAPSLVFGASRWQIVEVSHLFTRGIYRCTAVAEKSGAPWHLVRSALARDMRIVSGTIDDGESEPGEVVARDRLGCLPVRPAFSTLPAPGGEVSWSPSLPLISCLPTGGGHHGFVSDARQGDLCRVRIHTPLFAEVAGFAYRDDRTVKAPVRESTSGFVLHQEPEDWRGIAFEPSEAAD